MKREHRALPFYVTHDYQVARTRRLGPASTSGRRLQGSGRQNREQYASFQRIHFSSNPERMSRRRDGSSPAPGANNALHYIFWKMIPPVPFLPYFQLYLNVRQTHQYKYTRLRRIKRGYNLGNPFRIKLHDNISRQPPPRALAVVLFHHWLLLNARHPLRVHIS